MKIRVPIITKIAGQQTDEKQHPMRWASRPTRTWDIWDANPSGTTYIDIITNESTAIVSKTLDVCESLELEEQ